MPQIPKLIAGSIPITRSIPRCLSIARAAGRTFGVLALEPGETPTGINN
jgi:hypothetical protein